MKVTASFLSPERPKKEERAMLNLMFKAVKKYYHCAEENMRNRYTEVWFEMPEHPGRYPSFGFHKKEGKLYWAIDNQQPRVISLQCLEASHYLDLEKKYPYKNIALEDSFFDLDERGQLNWLSERMAFFLEEYGQMEASGSV